MLVYGMCVLLELLTYLKPLGWSCFIGILGGGNKILGVICGWDWVPVCEIRCLIIARKLIVSYPSDLPAFLYLTQLRSLSDVIWHPE